MNELYPIPKRQRRLGAFPTADAMRAAKAASAMRQPGAGFAVVSVEEPVKPAVEPVEISKPKKTREIVAKI